MAGTPYIIRYKQDESYDEDVNYDLVNPVFIGVTINSTENHDCDFGSGDTRVRFLGTYDAITFDSEDKSILLMGADNMLYYPQSGASIGAQRAYIKIGDGAALSRITSFNLNFGEGENTTGIISLTPDPSPKGEGSAAAWYSLDGRRLSGKPSRAGIYIVNGKKRVIK